jgi:hypothetical protein
MKRLLSLTNGVVSLVVAGCGTTSQVVQPSRLHVLDENKAYAVAYDSRGRGSYVSVLQSGGDGARSMKVCAEPAPDASANLSAKAATKFALEANATYQALAAATETGVDTTQKATSEIVDVAQRTELVLVLREALYRLCELNLNQVMDNTQAREAFDKVLDTTRLLGQRDNLGRIIALLGTNDLTPEVRLSLLRATMVLALGDAAAHSPDPKFSNAAFLQAVKSLGPKSDDEGLFIDNPGKQTPGASQKQQGDKKDEKKKVDPPIPPRTP